ncbi:16S rRNA (cytosine(1402)-N(4))-methyltransferase RsmH [Desulfurivibrio alkaliphilus]|uniref:Ribosomal RNA small subunit methyltransferase H n=1 Tax=Desulfurivibrio alkaliphilus (strain DSM 19089 / UNIQEM U267 / AHT2) TaxID=589865 RepID=D6Z3Q8_DESAT|nr:16S rRNA (cytosine(1402)-N(4))-methyltransferase RsmH [Desulfurivibrio alkaliphilus]ADH86183.1 S-adenosyl-methyltransferase MraW [Desulfurivibrio alkaliphilus AHT 2]
MDTAHQPVMPAEVLFWLAPAAGGIYVDGNLGLGGHAAAILEQSGPSGRLIGFDWDQEALARARSNLARFGDRVHLQPCNFIELEATLAELAISRIDGILLDLGLSSLQLDSSGEAAGAGRGFSFRRPEPLDMRMDRRQELTAADLLRDLSAAELADIFYYYGEERQARRIAGWLVKQRQQTPIVTTVQLAELVAAAVPRRFHPRNIHVATRVFQALRIAVNRELENLEKILAVAPSFLSPKARFVVISFHSLEDRLVKRAFREDPRLKILTTRPLQPQEAELQRNPRARSAKLRVAERREETA